MSNASEIHETVFTPSLEMGNARRSRSCTTTHDPVRVFCREMSPLFITLITLLPWV